MKRRKIMPVIVRKRRGSRPYKIIEKSTGKIKGTSTNRKDAEASARARNMAWRGLR